MRIVSVLTKSMGRIVAAIILTCGIYGGSLISAGEKTDQEILETLTKEHPRDQAIRKALAWIRTQQQEKNGALTKGKHPTTMTSLGVMAHLAAGITFDDPKIGAWLTKSLRFVISQQDPKGYYGSKDGSNMYGHGITTLMLAEALGMVRDEELEEQLRKSLERAVAITVNAALVKKSAANAGGWRYSPTSSDSDLSLSGWQLMSLHAAQQVGITVPAKVIKAACEYGKRNTTLKTGYVGYQKGGNSVCLRGLGLLCLAINGEEKSAKATAVTERIEKEPIKWGGSRFFYRTYYDAVGMSRCRPEAWEKYSPILEGVLLKNQHKDGYWPAPPGNSEGAYGAIFMTSLATLALTVDRHVLPAYQR